MTRSRPASPAGPEHRRTRFVRVRRWFGRRTPPPVDLLDLASRERQLDEQRAALVQLVSHELRTPLTVIRGSVETLQARRGSIDPELRRLVDATARATGRLEELLEVVLAATDELTGEQAHATPVDVAKLVEHAAASLHARLTRRLDLDMPEDPKLVTIEPYLWLTVRCLLDNAARFSPAEEPILVRYERVDDVGVLSLHDNGPGLPEGFDARAFEPFTQADASLVRTHHGLGMGLYTARRLTRRLGGELDLSSSDTGGVTASIRLPLVASVD